MLGGGDYVAGRRVDDDDACLRSGIQVDIVHADTGAGDDAQPFACRQHIGGDGSAASD